MVRITPLPAPINSPVGPFILSVQPGIGSYRIGITIEGRNIIAGNLSICSTTRASDKHLVKAYVFGILPKILEENKEWNLIHGTLFSYNFKP